MNMIQKRVIKVLERMIEQTSKDVDDAKLYAEILEDQLTSLQHDDFFGTEGQNDPRGDMRDGEWSMSHVQGVDE